MVKIKEKYLKKVLPMSQFNYKNLINKIINMFCQFSMKEVFSKQQVANKRSGL